MLDVEISELKAEVVKLRDDKEENKLKTQDVSPGNAIRNFSVSQEVASDLSHSTEIINNHQESKLSPSTDDDISASEDYSSCNMCNMKMVDASSDEISGLIEISLELVLEAGLLNEEGSVEYLGRDRICKATLRESCLCTKDGKYFSFTEFIRMVRKLKPDETPIPYDFQSLRINDSLFIDHFPIPWDDVLENRLRQLHSEKGVVDIFWGRSLKEDDTTWRVYRKGLLMLKFDKKSPRVATNLEKIPKKLQKAFDEALDNELGFSESSTGMGVIIHQLSHKDLDNLIQSIIDMASKDPKFKEISANAINKINNNRQNSALARIYMYTPEWYNARNNTEKSINSLEKFYELIWPDFETYDTYDIDQNASIDLSEYCDSSYSETETETESISSDSSYFSESDYIS
ncbi:unnamed protein product [Rhizophagus irregularis]|nr:unnamed protein product [Rhizophagus irregularis]